MPCCQCPCYLACLSANTHLHTPTAPAHLFHHTKQKQTLSQGSAPALGGCVVWPGCHPGHHPLLWVPHDAHSPAASGVCNRAGSVLRGANNTGGWVFGRNCIFVLTVVCVRVVRQRRGWELLPLLSLRAHTLLLLACMFGCHSPSPPPTHTLIHTPHVQGVGVALTAASKGNQALALLLTVRHCYATKLVKCVCSCWPAAPSSSCSVHILRAHH